MSVEAPSRARTDWLVPAALMALTVVPGVAGGARLIELAGGHATADNARFFAMPLPVVLHILSAVPFGLLGALQFAPAFRRRPRWHRLAGRLLAPLGLFVAISGLWMTLTYPWPPGDGQAVYRQRLLFGGLMLAALVLGVDAIRQRDFRSHGAWMTRAYAIGMGAGTQVLTHLPWFVLIGQPSEVERAYLMAAGWVINLVVAEWVIRSRAGDAGTAGTGRSAPRGKPSRSAAPWDAPPRNDHLGSTPSLRHSSQRARSTPLISSHSVNASSPGTAITTTTVSSASVAAGHRIVPQLCARYPVPAITSNTPSQRGKKVDVATRYPSRSR